MDGATEPRGPREIDYITDPRYQGIAEAKGYDQETARIKRVSYSHDAMIDAIIADPALSQNQLATMFGYSVPWVSRVIGSDSFQARLAQRKDQLIDPVLIATIEDKLKGLASQSLDIIAEKLQATQNPDLAVKAADLAVKALGFGARDRAPTTQNNFVVNLPPKAKTAADWAAAAQSGAYNTEMKQAKVVDALPISTTITRDPTEQPNGMTLAED